MPFLEDAVLVNLGSIMQKWTGDIYMATVSLPLSSVSIQREFHFSANAAVIKRNKNVSRKK